MTKKKRDGGGVTKTGGARLGGVMGRFVAGETLVGAMERAKKYMDAGDRGGLPVRVAPLPARPGSGNPREHLGRWVVVTGYGGSETDRKKRNLGVVVAHSEEFKFLVSFHDGVHCVDFREQPQPSWPKAECNLDTKERKRATAAAKRQGRGTWKGQTSRPPPFVASLFRNQLDKLYAAPPLCRSVWRGGVEEVVPVAGESDKVEKNLDYCLQANLGRVPPDAQSCRWLEPSPAPEEKVVFTKNGQAAAKQVLPPYAHDAQEHLRHHPVSHVNLDIMYRCSYWYLPLRTFHNLIPIQAFNHYPEALPDDVVAVEDVEGAEYVSDLREVKNCPTCEPLSPHSLVQCDRPTREQVSALPSYFRDDVGLFYVVRSTGGEHKERETTLVELETTDDDPTGLTEVATALKTGRQSRGADRQNWCSCPVCHPKRVGPRPSLKHIVGQFSVTISFETRNIPSYWVRQTLLLFRNPLRSLSFRSAFGLERGGSNGFFHLQGYVDCEGLLSGKGGAAEMKRRIFQAFYPELSPKTQPLRKFKKEGKAKPHITVSPLAMDDKCHSFHGMCGECRGGPLARGAGPPARDTPGAVRGPGSLPGVRPRRAALPPAARGRGGGAPGEGCLRHPHQLPGCVSPGRFSPGCFSRVLLHFCISGEGNIFFFLN